MNNINTSSHDNQVGWGIDTVLGGSASSRACAPSCFHLKLQSANK